MTARAKKKTVNTSAQHERVMKKLRAMSKAERIQTLVDAGILTKNHKVEKKYASAPVFSYRSPIGTSKAS